MMFLLLAAMLNTTTPKSVQTPSVSHQQELALTELKTELHQREKFIKAHAAEYLVWTGRPEEALQEFTKEEQLHGAEPKYRVVIWRILTQAEQSPERKKLWLDKIYGAYTDLNGPDRTHATEALSKLHQPVAILFPEVTKKTLASPDRALQLYAMWANTYGSASRSNKGRQQLLDVVLNDTAIIPRKISAYALRKSQVLTLPQWNKLAAVALSTQRNDELYLTFLTTALVTAPKTANHQKLIQIEKLLTTDVADYTIAQRTDLAQALADKGEARHLPLLADLLTDKYVKENERQTDEAADLRVNAAYAILKITNRIKK